MGESEPSYQFNSRMKRSRTDAGENDEEAAGQGVDPKNIFSRRTSNRRSRNVRFLVGIG